MNRAARLPRAALALLSLAFWVGVWAFAAFRYGKPLILPSPLAVCRTLGEMALTGVFWKVVFRSIFRILLGILAALLCGTLLAVLAYKSTVVDTLFSPLLALMKATPVASIIFLMLLYLGRDKVPPVIAFMMATPIVFANVKEGLSGVDRQLLEMARVFDFSFFTKVRTIYLHALLPYFLAALRSALSLAWKAGIAAEVLCVPTGSIGREIFNANLYLETDRLFALTLAVILISVLIEWGATRLLSTEKRRKNNA